MNEQNNIPPEALLIEIMRCNITAYQAIVSDQKETIAQLNARIAEIERELATARRWAAVSECDGSEWSKGYEAARDWVRGVGMAGSSPDGQE